MNANTKVWQVMTSDLTVVSSNASIAVIENLFNKSNFHHLPVEDDYGDIKGLISSADLSRASHFVGEEKKLEARHIMTTTLETISIDATVKEAVDLFLEKNYRALPVLDKSNVFVGLITSQDLLRCFQESMQTTTATS